jgi:hypothetical protein
MKANGTVGSQRQPKRDLTLPQLDALDLLAAGKTDKDTAQQLGLSRTCVMKWRLYDPLFQAALNRRRAEVWSAGIDRLRSLIPVALDALADELEDRDSPNRLKAAGEILRLARLPADALKTAPTDPEEIVHQVVQRRRKRASDPLEDILGGQKGLPPFEQHLADTWRELEALANEPDNEGQQRDGGNES